MKLISISLLPLIVLSFISIIFGNDFVQYTIEGEVRGDYLIIEQTYFNIDLMVGAIIIIITIASAVALIGLKILGTGLSDESVRTIIIAISYTTIWSVLSALAIPLLYSIDVFGILIYVALTIVFVIGVIEKMSGGD